LLLGLQASGSDQVLLPLLLPLLPPQLLLLLLLLLLPLRLLLLLPPPLLQLQQLQCADRGASGLALH
jgi:hypothetical protein